MRAIARKFRSWLLSDLTRTIESYRREVRGFRGEGAGVGAPPSSKSSRPRQPNWNVSGLRPKFPRAATVIDVGVGRGTRELYDADLGNFTVLVEPVKEFNDHCAKWLRKFPGVHVKAAAGPASGQMTIHVNRQHLQNSSLSRIDNLTADNMREERTVEVKTIDQIVEELKLKGPFILKIDTEGFDDSVLQGAKKTLPETLFVITECWFTGRYAEPSVTPVTRTLLGHGFSLSDILDVTFNSDGRCRWANFVFANDAAFSSSGP